MRRTRWLVAIAFVVVAGVVGVSTSFRSSPVDLRTGTARAPEAEVAPLAPTAERQGAVTPMRATTTPASVAPVAAETTPLPPIDSPLVQHLDELKQRAKRGDRRAACRLAREIDLCRELPELARSREFFIDVAARSEDRQKAESVAAFIARIEADRDRARKVCAGVPEAEVRQRFDHLLRAAELGVPGAAAQLLGEPALDQTQVYNQLEQWQAFRDRVPGLIERAALAGDPVSLFVLQRGLSGNGVSMVGYEPFEKDERRAAELAMVLSRFAGERDLRYYSNVIAKYRANATAAEFADTTAAAEDMHARLFRDTPVHDFDSGWTRTLTPDRCD